MNTDYLIERRCRYRLAKHSMKMHKKGNIRNCFYYAVYDEGDAIRDISDEAYRKLDSVAEYCGKLELQEKEYREQKRT